MGALTKKEAQAVSTEVVHQAGQEEILASDILIPKLLLMQGLSELVNARKAAQGDMVKSTTGEIVGGPDKPAEFIPLTFFNQWILQEKVGNKYEFRGVEPMTAANADLPWDFQQDGTQWKRVKSINVYALLPGDIAREREAKKLAQKTGEMPDPNTALMPVLVSFRSTSYKAGQAIVTHFARAKKYNLPGYVSTMKLKCRQDKNDLGTFYVFDVEQGSKASKEDQEVASEWYKLLATSKVRVDDSDLESGPSATMSGNSQY